MQKTVRRIISGARVSFDSRTTAEVDASRDMTNYKALEKSQREAKYHARKAKQK